MKLTVAGPLLLAGAACVNRGPDASALSASTRAAATADATRRPRTEATKACTVGAPHMEMESTLPPSWLAGEEQRGPCRMEETSDDGAGATTETKGVGGVPVTIRSEGPSGSGRHWEVEVSWPGDAGTRGFCLLTSTAGWRRVGAHEQLADAIAREIRWLQDVDGDSRIELVVRSTLALADDPEPDELGITAAAYDREGDRFILDGRSTRVLRSRLASAYRTAAERAETSAAEREQYVRAAERLQASACY